MEFSRDHFIGWPETIPVKIHQWKNRIQYGYSLFAFRNLYARVIQQKRYSRLFEIYPKLNIERSFQFFSRVRIFIETSIHHV